MSFFAASGLGMLDRDGLVDFIRTGAPETEGSVETLGARVRISLGKFDREGVVE